MKSIIRHGVVIGTGAASNVELGWVPNSVALYNVTDNDIITETFLDWILPFTSGGMVEILAGMDIKGATSNATARVKQVVASATTWSAGTAAGRAGARRRTISSAPSSRKTSMSPPTWCLA